MGSNRLYGEILDVKSELWESSSVSDSMKVTDQRGEKPALSGLNPIQKLSIILAQKALQLSRSLTPVQRRTADFFFVGVERTKFLRLEEKLECRTRANISASSPFSTLSNHQSSYFTLGLRLWFMLTPLPFLPSLLKVSDTCHQCASLPLSGLFSSLA